MSESRRTWPGPMSVAGVEPGHEHELPRALLARVRMLTRSLVIFGVCLAAIGTCLVLILIDRSNARDEQNQRTNERINRSICDLLDQFPEGGLLNRPRAKYHCGPGIPLDQLTPQEKAQVAGRNPAVAPKLPDGVEAIPGLPGGAVQQPTPQPYFPTPGVAEPPATVPYPPNFPPPDPSQPTSPGLLDPATAPVCDALGVCL